MTVDGAMQRDRIGNISAQCEPDRATMKIGKQRADRAIGGMRREQEMGDVIQGARALASGAAAATVLKQATNPLFFTMRNVPSRSRSIRVIR